MGLLRKAVVFCVLAIVVGLVLKSRRQTLPIVVDGFVAPGFEEVLETFRSNFENGVEPPESGSAFAAYYKGKLVANVWGGYADYEAYQPWREDSMAIVYSVTKGMAALCMALLVDRGHLDYEQKVVHYWPEFGQNGKENVTVKMLLNHEAGLAVIDEPLTVDLLADYERQGKVLARSPPIWEPGTKHGYHILTFGLYVSQLLTRADPKKRTVGQFFRDEIAKPFGIEFYIGLPKELNYRVGRHFTDGYDLAGYKSFFLSFTDKLNRDLNMNIISGKGFILPAIENAVDFTDFHKFNDPNRRALECASATGIGTAEGVAKMYGMLANGGVADDGKRIISQDLLQTILTGGTPLSTDAVLSITNKISYGFARLPRNAKVELVEENMELLGHPGNGGNHGYADPKYKLGFGFVTRYASPYGLGNDPRFTSLRDALYRQIEKMER